MNNNETSKLITTAIIQHRLNICCQTFHGLKDILEAIGKEPTCIPNFETLLEYCLEIIKSPIADKVTLVCDPVIAYILTNQFLECKTIPEILKNQIRVVKESLIYKSDVIYVLAERRNEDSLTVMEYTPIAMMDYGQAKSKYMPTQTHLNVEGLKSNG